MGGDRALKWPVTQRSPGPITGTGGPTLPGSSYTVRCHLVASTHTHHVTA